MTRFIIHNHFRTRDAYWKVTLEWQEQTGNRGGQYTGSKTKRKSYLVPGGTKRDAEDFAYETWREDMRGKQEADAEPKFVSTVRASTNDLQRYSGDVIWTSLSEGEYNKVKPGSEVTLEGRKAVVVDKDIVFNTVAGKLYRVKVRFK